LAKGVKGSCDEKYEDAELCKFIKGFHNCHCYNMFDVSKV